MNEEEFTLAEKCENLMNVVVESRKRFGKMCVDYDQKCSLMENKILNLQLETITNYRFKSKNAVPSIDVDAMCKDVDGFAAEISARRKRVDDLRKTLKETQGVVLQLKKDDFGKKLHKPLTADAMLAQAKQKRVDATKNVMDNE